MPQKKSKIIHVITTLGFGGAERLLLDLLRQVNRESFDYEVISMVGGGELEKDFRDTGVPLTIFYKKTKLGMGVFVKLYSYFKKAKPDIVHTHLFGADLWAGMAAYLAGVPIIIKTEHNVNLDQGWFKKMSKGLTAGIFKKFIAVSASVAEYMVTEEKIPQKKIQVIYNGIDLSRFEIKEKRGFSSPPILINVSRLEAQKGHEYLIRALKKIKDRPWVMWLVGGGSQKAKIERMVKDSGLQEKVKFFGERKDVPNLLSQADVFVLPSLWEGLGIVALEAGAVGLPIVASKVQGIRDVFEDNKNALLIEPRNEQILAQSIEWVFGHPDKALYLGREAQKLVRENYDIQSMTKKYEELYKNLLVQFI